MATKASTKAAVEESDEPQVEQQSAGDPEIGTFAISTKEVDYLGRSLITPGTVSKDYMGRLTTATADYMGLLLLDV